MGAAAVVGGAPAAAGAAAVAMVEGSSDWPYPIHLHCHCHSHSHHQCCDARLGAASDAVMAEEVADEHGDKPEQARRIIVACRLSHASCKAQNIDKVPWWFVAHLCCSAIRTIAREMSSSATSKAHHTRAPLQTHI